MTKIGIFKKSKVSKLNILPHTIEGAAKLLQEFPLTAAELTDVLPLGSKASSGSTGRILKI